MQHTFYSADLLMLNREGAVFSFGGLIKRSGMDKKSRYENISITAFLN
jgi:hypothetical protein